ncbi:MAG: hypothetical protein QM756_08355 [Polyangiaceae bacterium]
MVDPLEELFGRSSLSLFRGGEFVVKHGALERLPAFMREGPMQGIDALCRSYSGGVQIANGGPRQGTQLHVSEAHPATLLKLGLTVYFIGFGEDAVTLRRLAQEPRRRARLATMRGHFRLCQRARLRLAGAPRSLRSAAVSRSR